MSEKRLQFDCVMEFKKHIKKGLLFMVKNETNKGAHYLGLGLEKGAPDLMFIYNGKVCGIELKKQNSRHDNTHLAKQLYFGDILRDNGGYYAFVFSLEQFVELINFVINCKDIAGASDDNSMYYMRKVLQEAEKTKNKSSLLNYDFR